MQLTSEQMDAATGIFNRMNTKEIAVDHDVFVMFGILLGAAKDARKDSNADQQPETHEQVVEGVAQQLRDIVGAMWSERYCREIAFRIMPKPQPVAL